MTRNEHLRVSKTVVAGRGEQKQGEATFLAAGETGPDACSGLRAGQSKGEHHRRGAESVCCGHKRGRCGGGRAPLRIVARVTAGLLQRPEGLFAQLSLQLLRFVFLRPLFVDILFVGAFAVVIAVFLFASTAGPLVLPVLPVFLVLLVFLLFLVGALVFGLTRLGLLLPLLLWLLCGLLLGRGGRTLGHHLDFLVLRLRLGF